MIEGIQATYADGEVIFSQGDPAADLYVIVSGSVRIARVGQRGETELATLGPGDFFGEMGLFAPGPRTASAVAACDVEVEVIDLSTFKGAVPEPLVWRMLSRLSERVREAYDLLDERGSLGAPLT
ncbi:cyclic nucleotide-binding domain-containing protein [bacterium]|nr:cyclic nucleotide-binding domain-containing protein [bacterium]